MSKATCADGSFQLLGRIAPASTACGIAEGVAVRSGGRILKTHGAGGELVAGTLAEVVPKGREGFKEVPTFTPGAARSARAA